MTAENSVELEQEGHKGPSTTTAATTVGLLTRHYPEPRPVPTAEAAEPMKASTEAISAAATNATPKEAALGHPGGGLPVRVGLVLTTAGLCLLLFVLYVYSFSALQEHRDQRLLLNQFTLPSRSQILSAREPPPGRPAGVLTIPAIGLSQVVVEGTSATDLLKGPGLMPGTARPGSLGNAVIAGHASIAGAPFARLPTLRIGDLIEMVTGAGSYRYRTTAAGVTRPGSTDPTSPRRQPTLTLVTSQGTDRYFVRARLLTVPNRVPVPRQPPTAADRGVSGDAAAELPSVLWGLVLAVGFVGAFLGYWRFRGRHWTVYLLSTPTLLAIAFLWYENLIRLLPGTM